MWGRDSAGAGMPDKFEPLAIYNAEVSRGIVHTPEYRERMALLQLEFAEWATTDGG